MFPLLPAGQGKHKAETKDSTQASGNRGVVTCQQPTTRRSCGIIIIAEIEKCKSKFDMSS